MQAWWQKDQIISAFIIGSFSMTATLISLAVNSRRANAAQPSRSRGRKSGRMIGFNRVPLLFVAGLAAGALGYRIGSTAMSWVELGVAGRLEARDTGGAARASTPDAVPLLIEEATPAAVAHEESTVVATEAIPDGAEPRPVASLDAAMDALLDSAASVGAEPEVVDELSDWIYETGVRIHYRYAGRLPDACDGQTLALGNWVDGRKGVPVECIDDEWLVLDLGALLTSGRLTRNATYCFTLRSEAGLWARHDAAPAPGLERVAIASKSDFWGSSPLGFRVLRTDGPDQVEFGNGYPRVLC